MAGLSCNRDALSLLLEGGWVSGEAIAQETGITRAAVWKRIEVLREQGYIIEAATRKGYKLNPYDDLKPSCLNAAMSTVWAGRATRYFPVIDSTFSGARSWALEGAPHGALVIAEAQTGGIGRLSRAWQSPPGGLYMTMVLRPEMLPSLAPRLTMLTALAVSEALDAFGLVSSIKWPNDVLANGKKLCGILTQMSADMDGISYVLIGMGINVNQTAFCGELADVAASMHMITGKTFDRREVVNAVMSCIERHYDECLAPSFPMLDAYANRCATLGKDIRVFGSGEPYDAKAVGLTSKGVLIIEKDGERHNLLSGDVSVRSITRE